MSRKSDNEMYKKLLEEQGVDFQPETNEEEKKNMKERLFFSLFCIIGTFAFIFLFALCITPIIRDDTVPFWEDLFHLSKILFLWFGAPCVIMGFLMLFFPKLSDETDPIYVACGLYYGTIVLGSILYKFVSKFSTIDWFTIALIIVVCVINWYRKK